MNNNNNNNNNMGVRAIFSRELSWAIFAWTIFDSVRKNCYANLQICFAWLTPPSNYW